MEDYRTRIQNSLDVLKEVYPGLVNTALDYKEGRNILLNIVHRDANCDKAVIVKYLNDNTDFKYEIKRKR